MNPTVNTPAGAGRKSRLSSLRLVLILGSLSTFGPLSIDMYLPALPNLSEDLQTGTSLAQLSLTACLLGIALGQVFTGPVSDVYGRRRPLLAGLAAYVASSLLCAIASSIELFLLMRFIQGLAGSAGIVISRASVRDLYSGAEMTRFFALLMLVNGVAPIAAPILGGQILQFTSWRGIFIVLAVIGTLMLLSVWLGLRETLPADRRSRGGLASSLRTFQALLKNRTFIGYALSQGFAYSALFSYISGSPFVLQNIYGASPQMFSVFFAINGLGIIFMGQLTGRLAGRIAETKMLAAGLALAFSGGIALLLMILAGGGLLGITIPLFFVVSSIGIIGTSCFSLAMQGQAKAAGSAAALLGLLSFVLGGITAPLAGIAGSFSALPMGISIAVSETAAVLSYIFLVRRRPSQ